MAFTKALPNIEAPQPRTPVKVRRVDESGRRVQFHATQPAVRAIRAKGYGILGEKDHSGFCVLVVNDCFDFEEVLRWLLRLQTPEEGEEAAA